MITLTNINAAMTRAVRNCLRLFYCSIDINNIAAWKSVDVSYDECYEMMLLDESVFDEFFASRQDRKSTWHLFGEDQTEIWSTDRNAYLDPELLIGKSNSGEIFRDADGLPACAFSMTLDSPAWTLVRKVSMEGYENLVNRVVNLMTAFGGFVLLVTMTAYELWLKRFMRQFNSMLNGIVRMGQGELGQSEFEPSSIFVYTDGVPEATAASMEMFGEDRLVTALNSCPDSSPEVILQRVKSAVDSFVGDAEQFDDLTMMCLEYKGPEPSAG